MTFGEQLKQARKAANLTQAELADLVNSTKAAISRYEKGQRIPRSDIFLRLAAVLQLDATQMLSLASLAGFTPPQISTSMYNLLEWIDYKELVSTLVSLNVEYSVAKELIYSFFSLNQQGQAVASKRIKELAKIPDYKKEGAE